MVGEIFGILPPRDPLGGAPVKSLQAAAGELGVGLDSKMSNVPQCTQKDPKKPSGSGYVVIFGDFLVGEIFGILPFV
mgnify:CR=1 FL=1